MNNWENNKEQNTQNFVMVGDSYPSPEEKEEQQAQRHEYQAQESRRQQPEYQQAQTSEQTQQMYRQTQTSEQTQPHTQEFGQEQPENKTGVHAFHQEPSARPKQKKQKKEPRFVTRKAFVISLICCMIGTSALTIGGYTLASNLGIGNTTKQVSATNYTLAKATGSEKSVQEIIAQNENAVVEIRTESVSRDAWLQNYVTEGAGSGVIVDTKGYILTCNHVIENANKIVVTLKDGTELEASLVGADAQNDIAVLKVKANNLTAASYGDSSEMQVGDMVVAIGNPLGELGGSASSGIISALDRTITVDNREMTLMQTDTSINPGNSGGGLFDQYGNLIGIVVAKSTGSYVEGLGFAIPITKAAEIAKDLIENGHVTGRPAIGITIVDASDAETAMQFGLRMTGVYVKEVNGEEAKAAGFKAGDMIYYVGDTKIENQAGLTGALNKYKPGDKVKITVIRDNETVELTTKLIESAQ